MKNTSFDIRMLTLDDLVYVTNIHLLAFPTSALTKLGSESVRRYYEWQILGPHDSVNIGAFTKNELVGFCFGGIFRGALAGFIEKNRNFLIGQALTHPWLLMNPLFRNRLKLGAQSLLRILKRNTGKPSPSLPTLHEGNERSSFGILSIAVSPKYQGLGAAVQLMEYSENTAKKQGFTQMNLTVHSTNERAIAFYEKMGWQKDRIINEIWSGHMSKQLSETTEMKVN